MTLDQRTREAYEVWHRSLPVDDEADMPWHRLLREHLDLSRDVADRAVLEIGCGRGDLSRWLASRPSPPRRLVAADFAGSAVSKGASYARRRNLGGIDWQVADITRLPYLDDTFETVVSCETVEHVPHPERAFHELARVLKPGGRLLLTTPNYLSTTGLYRAYLRPLVRPLLDRGRREAMRVVQIVPSLPPPHEGVGSFAVALAEALSAGFGIESRFLVPSPGTLSDTLAEATTVLLHY